MTWNNKLETNLVLVALVLSALVLTASAAPTSSPKLYSHLMLTPDWIVENADFVEESALKAEDGKRITLQNPTPYYPLIFTVPVFKGLKKDKPLEISLKVSVQTPTGNDSDLGIGICDESGACAIIVVVDPNTYPFDKVFFCKEGNGAHWTQADIQGSSQDTGPFAEQVQFLLAPTDEFGAYIGGGGKVVTGKFPVVPDVTKPLYLAFFGDNSIEEVYRLQYIIVDIGNQF